MGSYTFLSDLKTYYGFVGEATFRIDYMFLPLRVKQIVTKVVTQAKLRYTIQHANCAKRKDHVPVTFYLTGATRIYDSTDRAEGW